MRTYNQHDVVAAVWGAALLGSGGGGSMIDSLNLAYAIQNATVNVLDQTDLDATRATTIGLMGTPKEIVDESDIELAAAKSVDFIRTVAENSGQGSVTAVMPMSINPMNVVLAFREALRYGLSVTNCDGAGRGTSSLATLTYAAAGVPISPVPIFSVSANNSRSVILDVPSAPAGDSILRSVMASPPFSGYCVATAWLMSAGKLTDYPLWGTLDCARQVGEEILAQHTIEQVLHLLTTLGREATKVFTGTLSIEHEYEVSGLTRRRLRIGNSTGDFIRIYTEKESMTYWDAYYDHGAGANVTTGPHFVAPDSICLWDEDSNKPLTDYDVPDFIGRLVTVVVISALDGLTSRPPCMAAYAGSLRALNYAGSI